MKTPKTADVPIAYYRALEDAATYLASLLDEGIDADTVTNAYATLGELEKLREVAEVDDDETYPFAPEGDDAAS